MFPPAADVRYSSRIGELAAAIRRRFERAARKRAPPHAVRGCEIAVTFVHHRDPALRFPVLRVQRERRIEQPHRFGVFPGVDEQRPETDVRTRNARMRLHRLCVDRPRRGSVAALGQQRPESHQRTEVARIAAHDVNQPGDLRRPAGNCAHGAAGRPVARL